MCFFTVLSETPARTAISLFVSPLAMPLTISRCRSVSGSVRAGRARSHAVARQPATSPNSNAAVRSTKDRTAAA
jgi:hypothetical protein